MHVWTVDSRPSAIEWGCRGLGRVERDWRDDRGMNVFFCFKYLLKVSCVNNCT